MRLKIFKIVSIGFVFLMGVILYKGFQSKTLIEGIKYLQMSILSTIIYVTYFAITVFIEKKTRGNSNENNN